MIKKIYLSPSAQPDNKYAYGNTNEQAVCNKIADAAREALIRCGFEAKKAAAGSMSNAIKESNAWGADLHIPIHTNAGGGAGCEVFVIRKDDAHLKYAEPVYNAIAALTVSSDRGIKAHSGLAEINGTNAICVYCECEFHDDATRAKWIIEHTDDIGEAIAKGVCGAAGKNYIAPAAPAESGRLYRVQVGAYSVKANADAMLTKVKAAGFKDAYINEK